MESLARSLVDVSGTPRAPFSVQYVCLARRRPRVIARNLLLCGASNADGRGFSDNVGGGEGPPVGSPLFWQNSHSEQRRLFGTHVCPFDGDDGDFGGGDSSGQRAGHLGFQSGQEFEAAVQLLLPESGHI